MFRFRIFSAARFIRYNRRILLARFHFGTFKQIYINIPALTQPRTSLRKYLGNGGLKQQLDLIIRSSKSSVQNGQLSLWFKKNYGRSRSQGRYVTSALHEMLLSFVLSA